MREHARQNTGIPVYIINSDTEYCFHLLNVSLGGLACKGVDAFAVDTEVKIRIPFLKPEYMASGRIAWCKKVDDFYELGIAHTGEKDKARLNMVEQVSHIEHYKNEVMSSEGRNLSGEEAAREWNSVHGNTYY